jgi:hypothetical protein
MHTYNINSRLYLGVHCAADVIGGAIIAAALLAVWVGFEIDMAVEEWLLHGTYGKHSTTLHFHYITLY